MFRLAPWMLSLVLALWTLPALAGITIAAPGSLSAPMDEVAALWNARGGPMVSVTYGHSPEQAHAIEMGEAPDLFIAVDREVMAGLEARHLLSGVGIFSLASTRLVLVGKPDLPPGQPLDARLAAALDGRPLAICDPLAVVGGRHAREALTHTGAWAAVRGRLMILGHPRAVLAAVDKGEARLGVAYRSDLALAPGLREVAVFPLESAPPVLYPVAVPAGHDSPDIRHFIDFLGSPAVVKLFEKFGFSSGTPE